MDVDIIARLEALPEERILDYFWLMSRSGAEKLPLLRQVGAVRVLRPTEWSISEVRRAHDARSRPFGDGRCFVCSSGDYIQSHHIIEVNHGGSNHPRNLVALCFHCHQRLHPWLTVATGVGMEPLSAIAPKVVSQFTGGAA